MATAEVLEFPQSDEHEGSPFSALIREARSEGIDRNNAIAEWIVDNRPDFWDKLTRDDKIFLVAKAVSKTGSSSIAGERRNALAGSWTTIEGQNGSAESVMRLAITGRAIWDTSWLVGETVKQTRDLNETDIAVLVRGYERRRTELTARMRWLLALLALMRDHKVKVAGGLEKKGVTLPVIEVEAGE